MFDTNFNAEKMASRRIERRLFIKLNSNESDLNDLNVSRRAHLDPRYQPTVEQKKQSNFMRIYYQGE